MISSRAILGLWVAMSTGLVACAAGDPSTGTNPHHEPTWGVPPDLGGAGSGRSSSGGSSGSGAGPEAGAPDAGGAEPEGGAVDAGAPASDAGSDAGPPSAACPVGPSGLDLHDVTIYSNPPDLADWPITTTLTEVDFTSDGVHTEFSKSDGPYRWPDVVPPGWTGPLQYTIGMVECIGGAWYTSSVIEVWYGLDAAGGNIALGDQVALNWYYDAVRWGMLAGRQPATGETIGIFVAAGNLRDVTTDDPAQSPVMERSNIVLVPMPDVSGADHSF